jgi:hypothetical protein
MAMQFLSQIVLDRNSAAPPEAAAARPRAAIDGTTRAALCLALTGLPLWAFTGLAPRACSADPPPHAAGHPDHSPALETAARNWLCLS